MCQKSSCALASYPPGSQALIHPNSRNLPIGEAAAGLSWQEARLALGSAEHLCLWDSCLLGQECHCFDLSNVKSKSLALPVLCDGRTPLGYTNAGLERHIYGETNLQLQLWLLSARLEFCLCSRGATYICEELRAQGAAAPTSWKDFLPTCWVLPQAGQETDSWQRIAHSAMLYAKTQPVI